MLFTFQLFVEVRCGEKKVTVLSVTSDWILLFGELPWQRVHHFGKLPSQGKSRSVLSEAEYHGAFVRKPEKRALLALSRLGHIIWKSVSRRRLWAVLFKGGSPGAK